ncbi:hypothetical protein BCR44DRAFT_96606, partial [Catenaria anguillulae PL171]
MTSQFACAVHKPILYRQCARTVVVCILLLLGSALRISRAQNVFRIAVQLPFANFSASSASALPIVNTLRHFQHDPTILNSIDPRYSFELIFTPSGRTTSASVAVAVSSVVEQNVSAIVGEFSSGNSLALGMALGSYFKTPMCSGSSGTVELSDKANYPLAFRTLS